MVKFTHSAAKTNVEWQVGCMSYFCHVEDHLSVLLCVTEFIALLLGEKYPCVVFSLR